MSNDLPPLAVFVRSWIFRLIHQGNRRLKVGKNLRLYSWLSIKGPGAVVIGDNCVVRSLPGYPVYMTTLYTHAANALLTLGNDVHLISARFACKFRIAVESGVVIEDASVMDTDFHSMEDFDQPPAEETLETCRVHIHNQVRVGSRAFITKGVVLGEGVQVFPGAVVQKSYAAHTLLIGNPARAIGQRPAELSRSTG